MRMRKQEHSPTRALLSGFLHEAFRPSVEINGMQSPELKNARFPHEILDPVFHGDKSFRVWGANKTFLLGGKNKVIKALFQFYLFLTFQFFYEESTFERKMHLRALSVSLGARWPRQCSLIGRAVIG
jgi:hypothetical protein